VRRRGNAKRLLVVVPTYNEAANLPTVYQRLFKAVGAGDLLIVDDASPDGTGRLADRFARRDRRVHVLHRTGKQGLGSAYVAGMQWAIQQGYALVVAMDADLQHDPDNIPRLVELSRDYDLVIGSRYTYGGAMLNWGFFRLFISRSANWFLKLLLGAGPLDCTGGFKCYRAELLARIGLEKVFSPGYSFQVEILYRALQHGARVVETPIQFNLRHFGESKLNVREVSGFFWTVLKLRFLTLLGRV